MPHAINGREDYLIVLWFSWHGDFDAVHRPNCWWIGFVFEALQGQGS
ncbi:hypothetical protein OAE26_01485 [Synechococcus sp. AH-551-E05]|nr:hypothetical protein [Synechococcus sp. AH-551-E05]